MLKPLRLLAGSLKQFAAGLLPGIVMAFVCLAVQLVLGDVIAAASSAISPPQPEQSLEELLKRFENENWQAEELRKKTAEVPGYTLYVSVLFFFHALVALILTAWLLRRRAGFDWVGVLRRAMRGAVLLTCAAAVVFAAAYLVDDVLPATRYVQFNFTAAAMVAVWFGASALLLPARLMGHEPVLSSGFVRNTVVATVALVPWFYASEVIGAPLRHCRDCGGMLDGGLFFLAFMGAYLLGLTVSSAAVSAAACMPASAEPAPDRPPEQALAIP